MTRPRAVELLDLPAPEPNLQDVDVVTLDRRLFLFYCAWPRAGSEGEPTGLALVEFRGWVQFIGGGPNDEALHNHPTFRHGVRWHANWEVLDSPAVRRVEDVAHKDGISRTPRPGVDPTRHFVFAFKEGTFEVFAEGYHLHGLFESPHAGMTALAAAMRRERPWVTEPPPAPFAGLEERVPREPCADPGCARAAVRFSLLCNEHHLAQGSLANSRDWPGGRPPPRRKHFWFDGLSEGD